MAEKKKKGLFHRLTLLFRSGPVVKRKIRAIDTSVAVPDKTKSSGTLLFQRSTSPTYSTITANAYNLSERLMRYQDFGEMEYTPELACLTKDSIISTPEGDFTIAQLLESQQTQSAPFCSANGVLSFPVYCYDHENKCITIGQAHSVRQTGNAETVTVKLDNGREIRCTSEHKFLTRSGEYVSAADLVPGTALMPFSVKSLTDDPKDYQYVYTMDKKSTKSGWRAQHLFNVEHLVRKLDEGEVVHHQDFDRTNNKLSNLKIMSAFDHSSYHASLNNENKLGKPNEKHSKWMLANNPVRRAIPSQSELEECRELTIVDAAIKFGVNYSVVLSWIRALGFDNWRAFCAGERVFLPCALNVGVNELSVDAIKGAYKIGMTKSAVATSLGCTLNVFDKFLNRKLKTTWTSLVETIGGRPLRVGGRPKGNYASKVTYQDICNAVIPGLYQTRDQIATRLSVSPSVIDLRLKEQGFDTFSSWTKSYHNAKVVSVTKNAQAEDVYDITTDVYHNFACNGVIVHNSALDIYADEICAQDEHGRVLHVYSNNEKIKQILEELLYNTLNVEFNLRPWARNLPVHKDTPIPLLDGTTLTIEELSKKMSSDPSWVPWVYSVQDETLSVVPGKVTWCGLTRENSELVRVWLDDETYIDCTPDHECILRDGSRKRADALLHGDSLMPLYRKISTKADRIDGYEQVYDPNSELFEYTHRIVSADKTTPVQRDFVEQVIHHKNFNKRNNAPENLRVMSWGDHHYLHATVGRELLYTPVAIAKKNASLAAFNKTEQFKLNQLKKSEFMKEFWRDEKNVKRSQERLRLRFDIKCLNTVIATLNQFGKYVGASTVCNVLRNDRVFMDHFKKINLHVKRDVTKTLNRTSLSSLIERFTGKSYPQFVINNFPTYASCREAKIALGSSNTQRKQHKNHKVLRIERLSQTSDVYCMEVLGPSGQHDRHNFMALSKDTDGKVSRSGVCLSNCKYGDFFLYNDVSPEHGVINVIPIPVNEIEREENFDRDDPFAVRYRWVSLANRILENWEVTHFRALGNDMFLPYGSSVIEPARRIWRQLILAEDAMLVYRVVRAPERRVIYVDVANIPPENVDMYVEQQRKNLRSQQVIDASTGRVDLRYSPLSVEDDYIIPVRGNESGTKIDTLAGGQNTAAVEDVAYIQKKLFAALKIPRAYLGYDDMLSCLSGDTQIPLLDGTTQRIDQLAARDWSSESQQNQPTWIYSCDPETHRIVPGKVNRAWKTKDVTEIYEVTTDDGGVVKCTENHPFMLRDGTYLRADQLQPGQSLMPLYRRDSISKKNGGKDLLDGYEMILNNLTNDWCYTHKLVDDASTKKKMIGKYRVIHHIDCDKHNNTPENLQEMTWVEHRKWHANNLESTLLRPDVVERRKKSVVAWLKSDRHRKFASLLMKKQTTDPSHGLYKWIHGDEISPKMSQVMRDNWEKQEYRDVKSQQSKELWERDDYRSKYMGENHWSRAKNQKYDIVWLCSFCVEHSVTSINQWKRGYKNSVADISPVGLRYVNSLLSREGYKTWREFAQRELNVIVPKRGPDRNVMQIDYSIDDLREFCVKYNVQTVGQWTKNHRNSVVGISPVSGTIVKRIIKDAGFNSFFEFQKTIKYNHKVISVKIVQLDEPIPVYDLEVEKWHNFAIFTDSVGNFSDSVSVVSQGIVFVHNSKSTLAQEDIRFSRTINVLQKTIISELNKIAIIHLYVNGYDGDELLNFTLHLSNPSTVAVQQKLELWRTRLETAQSMPEGLGSKDFIRQDIWGLSSEKCKTIDAQRYSDKLIDARVEAAGTGVEGGGEGGGLEDLGLGGEEGGGEEPEEAPPEEPEEPENAGELPPEEDDGVQLLVAVDDPDDKRFTDDNKLIKPNAQTKAARDHKYDLRRKELRRAHGQGARSVHMPDYKKMLSADNHSMRDPHDTEYLRSVTSNPFGENVSRFESKVAIPPDLRACLERMKRSLKIVPRTVDNDILAEEIEFDGVDEVVVELEDYNDRYVLTEAVGSMEDFNIEDEDNEDED